MSKFDIKPINQPGSLRFINVPGNMAIKADFGVLLYPKHNLISLSFDLSQSYSDFDSSDQYDYLVFITMWNDSPKTDYLCPVLPSTPNSSSFSACNKTNELFASLILSTTPVVSRLIESNVDKFEVQHNPLLLQKRTGKQAWTIQCDYINQKLIVKEDRTNRTVRLELGLSVTQLITVTVRRVNQVELDQLTHTSLISYNHRLTKMCLCPWSDSIIQQMTLEDYDPQLSGPSPITIFRPEHLTFPVAKGNYTMSAWMGVLFLLILLIVIFMLIWWLHRNNYWPYPMTF